MNMLSVLYGLLCLYVIANLVSIAMLTHWLEKQVAAQRLEIGTSYSTPRLHRHAIQTSYCIPVWRAEIMPDLHANGSVISLIDLIVGVALTGGFAWFTSKVSKRRYFPVFSGLLYSLISLFGAVVGLSAIELVAPALDTILNEVGPAAMLVTSGAVGVFFLVRSRYRQEMAVLMLLLVVYFFTFVFAFSLQLLPLLHPPSLIAIYAVYALFAAIALVPFRLLHKRLVQHLRLHLSPHPIRPMTVGYTLRLSAASAGASLLCLVPLASLKELAQLAAAVPWGGGACTGFFLLFSIMCWLHAAYDKRTAFVPVATWVAVIAHPADTIQEDTLLYVGATLADGTIPPGVQTTIDTALQSGSAATVTYQFDNELHGTQSLPSYCKGGWPQCLTCACRQAQVRLSAEEQIHES